MQKEAKARIKINRLLEEAGWRLLPSSEGRATVALESNVKFDDLGEDFEKTKHGFVDYLLLDDGGFPLALLEAKSEDLDPLVGKEKARSYAKSQKVRYVLLSNGNVHYFWDKDFGNPVRIHRFPPQAALLSRKAFVTDAARLVREKVESDYVALTQNPKYAQDPRWPDEKRRNDFIKETGLRFLRRYQLVAVHSLQEAVSEGKNRFLFEMATGTGKTLVAGAVCKLYLRTGNARRVLFLVDRLELENQARKNLTAYLQPDYSTVIFKENREDWRKADIVVTTVQSIYHDSKYLKLFAPTDFDLVISDEAHRSISGNSRAIFEYFSGAKLGLTATPRDYLKNLDERQLLISDPREWERRVLLSTYKTFGCESGTPTFRYTLADGVSDGYLIDPVAIDCRTEITTQLLSDTGYAVVKTTEDGTEQEVVFTHRDYFRSFFSEQTDPEFARVFLREALRDPVSGEVGKSIVFCVSRKHAARMTQLLNEAAHAMFPGKYQSDFAVQVTSGVEGSQQMAIAFANNNLNGHTTFLEGYKSSKTRVCVTVGMMTTGYDCEDLLNICLMRPIFSPTDFVQIKGRGTRTFEFRHAVRRDGQEAEVRKKKERFKLFDFFANCEYFEEKFPYDEVIKLPPPRKDRAPVEATTAPIAADRSASVDVPDPLKTMEILTFEGDVMRVDRELYVDSFETRVRDLYARDTEFKAAVDSGDYEQMKQIVEARVLSKSESNYTLDSVSQGYRADRRLRLHEILDRIFGKIARFKTREEIAQEEFDKFVVATDISSQLYYEAREFFKSYVLNEPFREAVNSRDFASFAGDPSMTEVLQTLGKDRIQGIADYIRENAVLRILD
jgi:type I restriction enzyme R subunit